MKRHIVRTRRTIASLAVMGALCLTVTATPASGEPNPNPVPGSGESGSAEPSKGDPDGQDLQIQRRFDQDWYPSFMLTSAGMVAAPRALSYLGYGRPELKRRWVIGDNGFGRPFTWDRGDKKTITGPDRTEKNCNGSDLVLDSYTDYSRKWAVAKWYNVQKGTSGTYYGPVNSTFLSPHPNGIVMAQGKKLIAVNVETGEQRELPPVKKGELPIQDSFGCVGEKFVARLNEWVKPASGAVAGGPDTPMTFGSWSGERDAFIIPGRHYSAEGLAFDGERAAFLTSQSRSNFNLWRRDRGQAAATLLATNKLPFNGVALFESGTAYVVPPAEDENPHLMWHPVNGEAKEISIPQEFKIVAVWRQGDEAKAMLRIGERIVVAGVSPEHLTMGIPSLLPPGSFLQLPELEDDRVDPRRDAVMWLSDRWVADWRDAERGQIFDIENPLTKGSLVGWLFRHHVLTQLNSSDHGAQFAAPPAPAPSAPAQSLGAAPHEVAWALGSGLFESGSPLEESVTRGQVAAVLYRYAGSPEFTPPAKGRHPDVQPGHPFFKEISWLEQQNVTHPQLGAELDLMTAKYRPDDPMLRGEFAEFLYRYSINYQHQRP